MGSSVNAKLDAHTRTETQTDTASFLIGTLDMARTRPPMPEYWGSDTKESEFYSNKNNQKARATPCAAPTRGRNKIHSFFQVPLEGQ